MAMAETRMELDERSPELDAFVRAFGEFGGVERRYAHISGLQTRDNGDPDSLFSATGRAIVFNSYSLDLGGFKEEIDPEAVREAMYAADADFHLLWDHDTTLVLARNRNGTLKAEINRDGVDFWGRVAKTTYAADLRVLMDRGDVDECSFAFTIADGGEDWRVEDDGSIVRRVTKIDKLWDLTICARGAYPATHSASVRSFVTGAAKERAGHNLDVADIAPTEERALKPGLVAWDDEQGFNDVSCDLERALERAEEERYTYWWVIDLNVRDGGTEAILCRYSPESSQYFLLQGITYDDAGDPVAPEDGMTPVEDKWVAVQTAQPEPNAVLDDIEEYGLEALEYRLTGKREDKRNRELRAIDAAFNRSADEPEAAEEPAAEETDAEEVPVDEPEAAEEPAAEETDADAPETETDERALAAARARARGRAAMA